MAGTSDPIKKRNNRPILLIIISIIIILFIVMIIIPGYFNNNEQPEEMNILYDQFTYECVVKSNKSGHFKLIVPIASNNAFPDAAETVYEFIKIVEGEGDISLIQSEYGPALQIISNSSITLKSENLKFEEYYGLHLSLKNNSFGKNNFSNWVYFESENISSVQIYLKSWNQSGNTGSGIKLVTDPEFQQIVNVGWQQIITKESTWHT